jgi:hypothetical protein
MNPDCCLKYEASSAQAFMKMSSLSGSTLNLFIRIMWPTCSSSCSRMLIFHQFQLTLPYHIDEFMIFQFCLVACIGLQSISKNKIWR